MSEIVLNSFNLCHLIKLCVFFGCPLIPSCFLRLGFCLISLQKHGLFSKIIKSVSNSYVSNSFQKKLLFPFTNNFFLNQFFLRFCFWEQTNQFV